MVLQTAVICVCICLGLPGGICQGKNAPLQSLPFSPFYLVGYVREMHSNFRPSRLTPYKVYQEYPD